MNKDLFLDSVQLQDKPPPAIRTELQALWWIKKGNWDAAHDLAQDANSLEGDWVHAYLHRLEGDSGNAAYWYARAQKPFFHGDPIEEWERLLDQFLAE
jgi:hypothetical protein